MRSFDKSLLPNLLKTFSSVGLITLLLLNIWGYYGVFMGLQYHNDIAMRKHLDAGTYDDSQTVTIKIPIAVPYMGYTSDFERVDGKFEHGGEFYRLVKQKYEHDTLTIVCVRDRENARLQQALTSYVETFTDTSRNQPAGTTASLSFAKDYVLEEITLRNLTPGWEADVVRQSGANILLAFFHPSIVHPPERA